MNWTILILAGLFEVAFAFCLGKAKGLPVKEAFWWYSGFVICAIISMGLLTIASRSLAIGTAYAVWTGIGAVGIVLVGIFFFNEPVGAWRLFFMFTLIASIIGLKYVSAS